MFVVILQEPRDDHTKIFAPPSNRFVRNPERGFSGKIGKHDKAQQNPKRKLKRHRSGSPRRIRFHSREQASRTCPAHSTRTAPPGFGGRCIPGEVNPGRRHSRRARGSQERGAFDGPALWDIIHQDGSRANKELAGHPVDLHERRFSRRRKGSQGRTSSKGSRSTHFARRSAGGRLARRRCHPYRNLMLRRNYERQKYQLQVELLKLQAWVKETGDFHPSFLAELF